jgi:hypothetical protein
MLTFETPLINAEDVDIPKCVANADEAIAIIREHRAQWAQRNAAQAQSTLFPNSGSFRLSVRRGYPGTRLP